jgi:hypothetical protein
MTTPVTVHIPHDLAMSLQAVCLHTQDLLDEAATFAFRQFVEKQLADKLGQKQEKES